MYYSYNDKGSSLKTGQYLAVNDGLTSPDGKNLLILGSDGNLVLSQLPGGTLWQSNTSGVSGQYFAIMQADGNFCIYMGSDPTHQGPFRWGTMASYRGPGQYLALLQNNGNFTIYTQNAGQTKTGEALWSTDTAPWSRMWSPPNWMGNLPGSKLLSQLTIPGTHDSGTYKGAGGAMAQCQTMSIADQLAAGIRRLDLGCVQVSNYFEIYHTVDQNVSFDDVYTACIQFLQAHPGECILMEIGSRAIDPINPIGSYEDVFNRYQHLHPDFWYLGDAIPTLDEVRGKIVLLRKFATVQPPKGIDTTTDSGLNTTYAMQRTSTVPRQSTYTIHVQGNYVVNTIFDIESHATTVTNFLTTAATATNDDWYINGASGASGGAYPNAVALGVAGTSIGTNAHIAATLNNYAPNPLVRFGTVDMDFPDAGLIRQLIDLNGYSCLSIGGYDLRVAADQAFAFDYDGSGKLDHLVLYRPGSGVIYILKNSFGQFSPVYVSATGIGGYDLRGSSDRAFAFDYDGSGKLDHLVFYRPGKGTCFILKNIGGTFSPVYAQGDPGSGIGGYNLADSSDQAFAFDYNGSGKLDHLVLYRPGQGTVWILKNSAGQFSPVYQSGTGIGGYDLRSTNDRALAFDYDGSGKLDHLVFYRPGSGACCILKNSAGQFSGVYWQGDQGSGIGGYNLRSTADRAFALSYDYTGYLKYLVFYRPGTGTIWILQHSLGTQQFTPIYAQGDPGSGIGGYNLADSSDRVFAFDYDGSGKLDHLVLYRPGQGIIYMVNQEQF